jgi:hypothetical protein
MITPGTAPRKWSASIYNKELQKPKIMKFGQFFEKLTPNGLNMP